jgi:hypothetical protein
MGWVGFAGGNLLLTQWRDRGVLVPVHAGTLRPAISRVNLNSPVVRRKPPSAYIPKKNPCIREAGVYDGPRLR